MYFSLCQLFIPFRSVQAEVSGIHAELASIRADFQNIVARNQNMPVRFCWLLWHLRPFFPSCAFVSSCLFVCKNTNSVLFFWIFRYSHDNYVLGQETVTTGQCLFRLELLPAQSERKSRHYCTKTTIAGTQHWRTTEFFRPFPGATTGRASVSRCNRGRSTPRG